MIEQTYIDRLNLIRLSEIDTYYNFECPFCLEGNSAGRKKRAFIRKNKEYHFFCYNCNMSLSFTSLLYNLDKSLYYQFKEEMKENKFYEDEDRDHFLKKNTKQKICIEQVNDLESVGSKFTDYMSPVRKNIMPLQYLLSRNVPDEWIDKLFYYYNEDSNVSYNRSIIFPFYNKGFKSFYGFQSRQLYNKFFHIELKKTEYPKIWNLFNVDNTKPVYIFEGFFDAVSIDNSVALNGADIPHKYMSAIQNPIFVFDNDYTGFKKASKYADMGYNIMMYPPDFKHKDINEFVINEKISRKEVGDFIRSGITEPDYAKLLLIDRELR